MYKLIIGALLALTMLVSFVDEQDPYPGHPPIDTVAATAHCPGSGPPPPNGFHWEYDVECIAEAAQAHEDGWRAGYKVYSGTRDRLIARLAQAKTHLANLLMMQENGTPYLQPQINEQKVKIAALEATIKDNEASWTDAKAELKDKFYEAIDDCCIYVQNG